MLDTVRENVVITPGRSSEQGKMIGVGVHIYIYIRIYVTGHGKRDQFN